MITVIVAVYNGADTIKRCLDSVLGQKGVVFELIVIDGGSSDRTVNILNAYEDDRIIWISEPDHGIYNAWNKALKMSSGEWICFLGADDVWVSNDSLSRLEGLTNSPHINFVCGHNRMIDSDGRLGRSYGAAWDYDEMKSKMTVAHVGSLHHRSLFDKYGVFDESYRIAGDYEFLLRAGSAIRGAYLDEDVIFMGSGGVSRMQPWLVFKEARRAQSESANVGLLHAWMFYVISIIKYSIRSLLNFFRVI